MELGYKQLQERPNHCGDGVVIVGLIGLAIPALVTVGYAVGGIINAFIMGV